MSDYNLPAAWNASPVLDGLDLTDKKELIGVPFRILGVSYRTLSQSQARQVQVDVETADGRKLTFGDASTGVKEQISGYLTSIKKDHVIEMDDEYLELDDSEKLVIPNGLRISEWEREIRRPNGTLASTTKAYTYYLTTNGQRKGQASAPAPKATRARSNNS